MEQYKKFWQSLLNELSGNTLKASKQSFGIERIYLVSTMFGLDYIQSSLSVSEIEGEFLKIPSLRLKFPSGKVWQAKEFTNLFFYFLLIVLLGGIMPLKILLSSNLQTEYVKIFNEIGLSEAEITMAMEGMKQESDKETMNSDSFGGFLFRLNEEAGSVTVHLKDFVDLLKEKETENWVNDQEKEQELDGDQDQKVNKQEKEELLGQEELGGDDEELGGDDEESGGDKEVLHEEKDELVKEKVLEEDLNLKNLTDDELAQYQTFLLSPNYKKQKTKEFFLQLKLNQLNGGSYPQKNGMFYIISSHITVYGAVITLVLYSVYLIKKEKNILIDELPEVICTSETQGCIETSQILTFISKSTVSINPQKIMSSEMSKLIDSTLMKQRADKTVLNYVDFLTTVFKNNYFNAYYNDIFNRMLGIYYPSEYSSTHIILGAASNDADLEQKIEFSRALYITFVKNLFTS